MTNTLSTKSQYPPGSDSSTATAWIILILLPFLLLFGAIHPHAETSVEPAPINLELQQEGRNLVVSLQNFIKLMKDLFPDSEIDWNPLSGVLAIQVDQHYFQASSGQRVIFLDRRARIVQQPIMLKKGQVLIPVKMVQLILETLMVQFDIETPMETGIHGPPQGPLKQAGPRPIQPTPTSIPFETPGALSSMQTGYNSRPPTDFINTPGNDSQSQIQGSSVMIGEDTTTLRQQLLSSTPNMETVQEPDLPESWIEEYQKEFPLADLPRVEQPEKDDAKPPQKTHIPTVVLPTPPNVPKPVIPPENIELTLQPPKGLAGQLGLSWAQLADWLHRQPPKSITIIHDSQTAAVAALINEMAEESAEFAVRKVKIKDGKRGRLGVLNEVRATFPELCIDLIHMPVSPEAWITHETFRVWVVHEALWPQDRHPLKNQSPDESKAYRNHQFQALGLGSLIRSELGHQFPDQLISFELSPSWLLRRLNAPSAGILIPDRPGTSSEDPYQQSDRRIAGAIHSALTAYVRGMRNVQF